MHSIRILGVFVFLGLSQNFVSPQSADYCSTSLCSDKSHIACGNSGKFDRTCPSNAAMVTITDAYKSIILQSHNSKRNTIAKGDLKGYLPAKRMATMQWDSELAKLAALNVKQCVMAYDKCRNTDRFKYSGQNLGIAMYTGNVGAYNDTHFLKNQIDAWWNEYSRFKNYPSNYSGPEIGHFTIMTSQRNNYVGCGVARFTKDGWNNILLACNYAYTNMYGAPLYDTGTTASGCTTGKNEVYTGLCSINEVYK